MINSFTVDFAGTPSPSDRAAAINLIDKKNAERDENDQLPKETGAQIKASYLFCLGESLMYSHTRLVKRVGARDANENNVKDRWARSTAAQRTAALAALAE